jgi:cell wall-associated NlpC family hydrolase
MKNLFFLITITSLATSCSTLQKAGASQAGTDAREQKRSSLQFIDNVSVRPGNDVTRQRIELVSAPQSTVTDKRPVHVSYSSAIDNYSSLQFKYAILEDAAVEEMQNQKLLEFMEEWYGTKYHYGGIGKTGIDCSAFVSTLMSSVYGISNLPRISRDQYLATSRIKKNELQEGDLVFFHTYGKKRKAVTHVGIYLRNNKFIHASVSGVMISDMGDGYYASHYVGAGRAIDGGMRDAAAN